MTMELDAIVMLAGASAANFLSGNKFGCRGEKSFAPGGLTKTALSDTAPQITWRHCKLSIEELAALAVYGFTDVL